MTALDGDDEICEISSENLMTPLFSTVKKIEANPHGRSPFRDRNVCCS